MSVSDSGTAYFDMSASSRSRLIYEDETIFFSMDCPYYRENRRLRYSQLSDGFFYGRLVPTTFLLSIRQRFALRLGRFARSRLRRSIESMKEVLFPEGVLTMTVLGWLKAWLEANRKSAAVKPRHRRIGVEVLEHRYAPAVLTVTNFGLVQRRVLATRCCTSSSGCGSFSHPRLCPD